MPKYWTITCPVCSKVVRRQTSKGKRPIYCSRQCFAKVPKNPNQYRHRKLAPRIQVNCLECGKQFEVTQAMLNAGRGKFCSTSCSARFYQKGQPSCNPSAHIRIALVCKTCGKPFEVLPYRVKQNAAFCSSKCFNEVRGPNHPHWQGGYEYCYSDEWDQIAGLARTRDGHRCTRCGMTNSTHLHRYGRSLDIHHIIPFKLSGDNALDNLRTLCAICHCTIEPYFKWLL